jgi:AcrR family transcriptional regulator
MTGKKPIQDKKKSIVNAVIFIIGEKGVSAVTHRAAAKRAGVSLSATTYYFKSRDDMIESAFINLIEEGIIIFNDLIEKLQSSSTNREAVFIKYLNEVIGEKSGRRIRYIATLELILESLRNNRYKGIIDKYSKVHVNLLKFLLKKEFQDPYSIFVVQSLLQTLVFMKLSMPDRKFMKTMLRRITRQYFNLLD